MFLKRLEIIGFKSFAEKIGVDFVPGVTAVVGPNGSGKSNIIDAIRWVLGEQSAKSLRGAKMEDVIFSGSDSRKPLNYAEVSLILDNSKGLFPLDYTEISVTRRVFRSGDSVYLLNGQQCRLKDITDVFMDSGLGKEAFSIISQGRVDEILNSKPEDRRNIFDEAAGVLKYRKRKKKAEHKLFETTDNLDRVLDILQELDSRLEPLERQAKAAKTYEQLVTEVRDVDIHLLNLDALQLRRQLEEKDTFYKQRQAEKESIQQQLEEKEQALQQLKERLEKEDFQLDELQVIYTEVIAENEKWEGRKLLSVEKEKNSKQQLERIHQTLEELEQEEKDLADKIAEVKETIENLTTEHREIEKDIQKLSNLLNRSVTETEQKIEHLKAEYIDLLNEEATVRNELKHIDERMIGEQASSEKIAAETKELNERLATDQAKNRDTIAQLEAKKSEMTAASKLHQTASQQLLKQEEELRNKQQLLQQAHNKQYEMQGRLRTLESLEADFSGFYSGVKEVLQAREQNHLQGIEGAVAELLTVDSQYVEAIETALGGAMQHIITSTEQHARQAIDYLKRKRKGRATFLPVDVIKPRMISAASLRTVQEEEQYVGMANELVTCAPNYTSIKDNLLGSVVVAKTLAGASKLAKLLQYRYRVVTLDGDIVNAGGSLTGGGTQQKSSVFSRRAELEQLTKQVEELTASIGRGEDVIRNIKFNLSKTMQEASEAEAQKAQLQNEVHQLEAVKMEQQLVIRSIEKELEAIMLGLQGSTSLSSTLAEKKIELSERHEELKQSLETIQSEVKQLERYANDWKTEEAALTAELTEKKQRFAILKEQLSYQNRALLEMNTNYEDVTRKIKHHREEAVYLQNIEREQLSAEEIASEIEKVLQEKSATEQKIAELRKNRQRTGQTVTEEEANLQILRQTVEEHNRMLETAKVEYSRLEVMYDNTTKRLREEYGFWPDETLDTTFDVAEKRRRLTELKMQIEALGPVNPTAIAEFEEVSERHTFLTAQRNDLLEAKETLEDAMTEMDQEMTIRFKTTFNAVQIEFRRVYQEMFGGGNADLILTDSENLLETGIEIVARPPGKKMQNLSLLSGGERALTAISLLFAIIEVRPVPFCILDEVEAALDEANVLRYSDYLKRCATKTQFIVITHRKGTMEGADVLYGVTMQESGVSKLISVKLADVPQDALVE